MIRQPPSNYSCADVIDKCYQGVTGNLSLKANLHADKTLLTQLGATYEHLLAGGLLHTIAPSDSQQPNPLVTPNLTREEASKLYSYYLTDRRKPARKIYSDLLAAAEELCPFCGGIGRPRNLDHFLPKSRFAQFAILPKNLVPSCRDCNMDGKAEVFALNYEDQIVHPNLDKSVFFDDQWISASFSGNPGNPKNKLAYYVDAPPTWLYEDKKRAENHFATFDIATRYAIKSAQMRRIISSQVKAFQAHGTPNATIQKCLIDTAVKALKVIPNHWLRGLYQAYTIWLAEP